MSNYSSMDGVLYCKTHFEQLFKESGNFSKNFHSGDHSILYMYIMDFGAYFFFLWWPLIVILFLFFMFVMNVYTGKHESKDLVSTSNV